MMDARRLESVLGFRVFSGPHLRTWLHVAPRIEDA